VLLFSKLNFPLDGKESAMAKIVIVSNGTEPTAPLFDALAAAGHEVTRAPSLAEVSGDVLYIDSPLFRASESAAAALADTSVVVLTSAEELGDAMESVKAGAIDVLRLPASAEEIELSLHRALRFGKLIRENDAMRGGFAPQPGAMTSADSAPAASTNGDFQAVARNLAGKPLADIEKQVILSTLEQFKGHRLRTAAALGIGVRTLGMKIKRWREEGEPIAGRQPRPAVHVDVS